MKKTWIKTPILVVLIIGCIFQTTRLWFDDLSDRNFFYSIFNKTSTDKINLTENEKKYFIIPELMAVYNLNNENEFTVIKKTGRDFENIFNASIYLFKELVTNGEYLEGPIAKDTIWKNGNILMQYPFDISAEILLDDLDVDGVSAVKKMPDFDEIIVSAAADYEQYITVYFINSEETTSGFKIDKEDVEKLNNELNQEVESLEKKELPKYISTETYKFSFFNNNILLPIQKEIENELIYLNEPFHGNKGMNEEELKEYVRGFLSNDIKWNKVDVDQWTYSDENAVVKYSENGILEYDITDKSNDKNNTSIINSYQTAHNFLNKDNKLFEQEYYLEKFIEKENEITFYFGYKFNDYKIIISSELREIFGITFPMEITIANGQVKHYKRLLLEKENYIEQKPNIVSSFRTVLDKFLSTSEQIQIEDMYLGYYMQSNDGILEFKWMIKTDNTINVIELE